MKKVLLIVGARPNFMKAAPLFKEFKKSSMLKPILVHTGQHYDFEMSDIFFKELGLSKPKYFLGVGSASHAVQTAKIMTAFEKVLLKERPAMVVVFGDVNSTLAASLVAKKLFIKVAHVEAGLRSFDMTMPEEINRILTDRISDLLFTPSTDANKNLIKEGVNKNDIFLVGNIMIDSLKEFLEKTSDSKSLKKYNLESGNYILATLHRPVNVDKKENLSIILKNLEKIAETTKVVFPVHPRTIKNIQNMRIEIPKELIILKPLGYKDFISLEKNAKLVITDSGGIQEETSFLNVPCITVRPNTERPITIRLGTNILSTPEKVFKTYGSIVRTRKKSKKIPLWDGKTAARITKVLERKLK